MRADIGPFMKSYGRKAPRGRREPNDRQYSCSLERKLKSLPPDELDRLLRDLDDDEEAED